MLKIEWIDFKKKRDAMLENDMSQKTDANPSPDAVGATDVPIETEEEKQMEQKEESTEDKPEEKPKEEEIYEAPVAKAEDVTVNDVPVVEEKPDPLAQTEEKPTEEEKPAPYTEEDAAQWAKEQKKIQEEREKKAMELEQELKTKLGDNYGWYMDKLMASVNK